MAEEQTAVQEETPYSIKVEDAGPATKKIVVEIPADRIQKKLAEQFKELRGAAQIPGFRKGHAPAKLIEKKFGNDLKDEVQRELIRDSYQQALKNNSLQVIGEPEFEEVEKIKLPESGPLSYSFQVEVQPDFEVPSLEGIKITKPKREITESHVDEAMQHLREQQGALVPVEDRGVAEKDRIVADIHIRQHSNVIGHFHDAQMIVGATLRIGGYTITEFDKQMEGAKLDEARTITVKAPEDHPAESVRGQEVQIEVKVKDIKRLELATIDATFLDSLGLKDEAELRGALREQMVERIVEDGQRLMRQQVMTHLLANIKMEVPAKLSSRQRERVVGRRATQLALRGVPREQISANIDKLASGAEEEAANELKSFFILQKIATDLAIDVNEGELNGRVYAMAMQEGQRPEKLKQEMGKDGRLANLYVQLREEKAMDHILSKAQIEEVEAAPETKDAGESSAT